MIQLEQYEFKRDIFTAEVQKIYLASKDQTLPNNFFEDYNVDKKMVIKTFQPQDQNQIDYNKLIETEAQNRKNILIQFNSNETKKMGIDIINKYLESSSEKKFNTNTLQVQYQQLIQYKKIRQNYHENQSELMPPPFQSDIQVVSNNISQDPNIIPEDPNNISQATNNITNAPNIIPESPSQLGPPTQSNSQINQINQHFNIILPVTQTYGFTQQI